MTAMFKFATDNSSAHMWIVEKSEKRIKEAWSCCLVDMRWGIAARVCNRRRVPRAAFNQSGSQTSASRDKAHWHYWQVVLHPSTLSALSSTRCDTHSARSCSTRVVPKGFQYWRISLSARSFALSRVCEREKARGQSLLSGGAARRLFLGVWTVLFWRGVCVPPGAVANSICIKIKSDLPRAGWRNINFLGWESVLLRKLRRCRMGSQVTWSVAAAAPFLLFLSLPQEN